MNEDDLRAIEQQLGRTPSGLQQVMKRTTAGLPAVLRVASVVRRAPFPTLFWISDSRLNKLIHHHESMGMTKRIQRAIDESAEYGKRLVNDHQKHVKLRQSYLGSQVKQEMEIPGVRELLSRKGIGGVANFTRVRCLHAFLAAHLVVPNLVGELLFEWLEPEDHLAKALEAIV